MGRLLDEGWSMRVLVRDASKLEDSVRQRVEVVEGGAESDEDIARAMAVAKGSGFRCTQWAAEFRPRPSRPSQQLCGEVESEGARVERRCGTLNRLGRDDGHMRTVLKVMAKQRRNP